MRQSFVPPLLGYALQVQRIAAPGFMHAAVHLSQPLALRATVQPLPGAGRKQPPPLPLQARRAQEERRS